MPKSTNIDRKKKKKKKKKNNLFSFIFTILKISHNNFEINILLKNIKNIYFI